MQTRGHDGSAPGSSARDPVIYGSDDRVDVFQTGEQSLRALALESVGALVPQNRLVSGGADAVTWRAPSLAERSHVCATERFAEQPSLADCSGVLIDEDLVLTAGHCLGGRDAMAITCRDMSFLFGFAYGKGPSAEPATMADVFACKRVLVFSYDPGDRNVADFAVLLLERPATEPAHRPATVSALGAVGQGVHLIGNGAGLPTKIDSGGKIVDAPLSEEFFSATTDSFSGGSGSGIFDGSFGLVGIQSRGQSDWMVSLTDNCRVATVVTSGWERHQHASRAVEALCASGWPSERLCGATPVCGDGACAPSELSTCAEDCRPSRCGDGVCSLSERASCPSDCEWLTAIPPAWTCAPRYYGDGTNCHCGCGAPDPDCGVTEGYTLGCSWGQTCSPEGSCQARPLPPAIASSERTQPQCGICWLGSPKVSATFQWLAFGVLVVFRRARARALRCAEP